MIRVALGAIWANKLRSFLTILGNVVAVASIVTLVSLIWMYWTEIVPQRAREANPQRR